MRTLSLPTMVLFGLSLGSQLGCTVPTLAESGQIQCGPESDPHRCPGGFRCVGRYCCANRLNDTQCGGGDADSGTDAPAVTDTPTDTPVDAARPCAITIADACIPSCSAGNTCRDHERCVEVRNPIMACARLCDVTADCSSLATPEVAYTCHALSVTDLQKYCVPDCRVSGRNFCGSAGACVALTGFCR